MRRYKRSLSFDSGVLCLYQEQEETEDDVEWAATSGGGGNSSYYDTRGGGGGGPGGFGAGPSSRFAAERKLYGTSVLPVALVAKNFRRRAKMAEELVEEGRLLIELYKKLNSSPKMMGKRISPEKILDFFVDQWKVWNRFSGPEAYTTKGTIHLNTYGFTGKQNNKQKLDQMRLSDIKVRGL
jgi:hypothetical protein